MRQKLTSKNGPRNKRVKAPSLLQLLTKLFEYLLTTQFAQQGFTWKSPVGTSSFLFFIFYV